MKFVRLEDDVWGSNFLDPSSYLVEVEGLSEFLPPGARRFATDPDHYNFSSVCCVKDLELIRWANNLSSWSVELYFAGNQFKHDLDLRIVYSGVSKIEAESQSYWLC